MPLSTWFWVIYVLALLFGLYGTYRLPIESRFAYSGWFVIWVLLGILGWRVFQGPVTG